MTERGNHIVIVTFATDPANQQQALDAIGGYVASFLSQQPGFVRSRLHASLDHNSVVHYAEWVDEAAFQAAGAKARSHPDLPALMSYKPNGVGYQVWQTYTP